MVKAPTLTTVHTTTAQEYGDHPAHAFDRGAPVVTHVKNTAGDIVGAQVRKAAYPADLHRVCPNMPTVATVTLTARTTLTSADGTTTTLPAGATVYIVDATAADLAAWKATRTKRHADRADRGRYQIDARTAAAPVDTAQSEAARQAWRTRRAGFASAADVAPFAAALHALATTA